MKWMNLPKEYSEKKSKYWIIPISFEGKITFQKGTMKGPSEIIKASNNLEYYDTENQNEPYQKGIFTNPVIKISKKQNTAIEEIKKLILEIPANKIPIMLGGDHSITIGIINGIEENENKNKKRKFSIIMFDAHADLRDEWNDDENNHACVAKKISKNHKLLQVGIRSQDYYEAIEAKENPNIIQIIKNKSTQKEFKKQIKKLEKNIYLTIDLDVIDPSLIRNVGTPEPDGLKWNELVSMIEEITKTKNIIGIDIVEFSPRNDYEIEAYFVAKLIYKIISIIEKNQK